MYNEINSFYFSFNAAWKRFCWTVIYTRWFNIYIFEDGFREACKDEQIHRNRKWVIISWNKESIGLLLKYNFQFIALYSNLNIRLFKGIRFDCAKKSFLKRMLCKFHFSLAQQTAVERGNAKGPFKPFY